MELMDVGLWGMCMALCVWVGAAMALVSPPQQGRRGGGNYGGHLGFSTMCLAVQGALQKGRQQPQQGGAGAAAGAELRIAPGRREFFI